MVQPCGKEMRVHAVYLEMAGIMTLIDHISKRTEGEDSEGFLYKHSKIFTADLWVNHRAFLDSSL